MGVQKSRKSTKFTKYSLRKKSLVVHTSRLAKVRNLNIYYIFDLRNLQTKQAIFF